MSNPWLDLDDPRRNMTDEEILDKYIDLTNSNLSTEESSTLMNIIKSHKEAFSLRDEIGKCPNIKIDIDVVDDFPFFVRPFPVHEEDKPLMDTLKPESQSKSQQTLAKPTPITPGRKVLNPVVRWTPSQTPAKSKLKSTPSPAKVIPRALLNTPVQSQTPMLTKTPPLTPGKQNIAH